MGGGGSAPTAPKFKPVPIPQAEALAKSTDIAGFNASDADLARRFPLIPQGRTSNIQSAITNLSKSEDPAIASALTSAGLSRDISGTQAQKARSMGEPLLPFEQRNRNYFTTLLADNPERQAGIGGAGVSQIAISNATGQNAFNQGVYGTGINAANANAAQQAQLLSAGISAFGGLASAGIRGYNQPSAPQYSSNYLTSGAYGTGGAFPWASQPYVFNPSGG